MGSASNVFRSTLGGVVTCKHSQIQRNIGGVYSLSNKKGWVIFSTVDSFCKSHYSPVSFCWLAPHLSSTVECLMAPVLPAFPFPPGKGCLIMLCISLVRHGRPHDDPTYSRFNVLYLSLIFCGKPKGGYQRGRKGGDSRVILPTMWNTMSRLNGHTKASIDLAPSTKKVK